MYPERENSLGPWHFLLPRLEADEVCYRKEGAVKQKWRKMVWFELTSTQIKMQ